MIHVKTNVQLLVALVLLSAAKQAYALPAPTLISPNLTSIQQQQSSPLSSIPPTCDNHMGVVTFDDCNAAIGMFPRDQLAQPILRNFYTDPADESSMMPNVLVPMEKTYGRYRIFNSIAVYTANPGIGGCTAQVLLATNFNDVPHDQSSWIDLIGPMRNILRQCARGKGTGGVLVRNGVFKRNDHPRMRKAC